MANEKIILYDSTLRDGNHAVNQQITKDQIIAYCQAANEAKIPYVEIGHGNGLGASSIQVGQSPLTSVEMLKLARPYLKDSKMATFMIPGWGTIHDLERAIDYGVDVIRIGAHCTESNLTKRYINFLEKKDIEVHGVLIMSHMASAERLAEEAKLMEDYGAKAIGIFDSSGFYLPQNVSNRIEAIRSAVKIPIIFHGHNNLGMVIANSITAINKGATIIDGCIRGFGAGAGNAPLEVLVVVLKKLGFDTGVDLYKILDAADKAKDIIGFHAPFISTESIVSGDAGVFSGFKAKAIKIANAFDVNVRDILYELGRRQAVAGQEDLIMEVAQSFQKKMHKEEVIK